MRDIFKVIFVIIFGGGFLLMIFQGLRGLIKILMGKTSKTEEIKTEITEEEADI